MARAIQYAVLPPTYHASYRPPALPPPPAPEEADWATVLHRWKARWQLAANTGHDHAPTANQTPCWNASAVRRRHHHLTKAESSLLTQIRTGHIGLRAYLFRRQAVDSPECQCGADEETAAHVLLNCTNVPPRPPDWPCTTDELHRRLRSGLTARPLLRWLIRSERLPEYSLARALEHTPA
ncbi:uncharacterized protein SPSK_06673 [Sporothrix schenckii 1099-18]|uniref:Reverse transcriptase n=1 Tax=Sporothrix schenckii 1099-18 TaxID=1397361 RepID=A0A0F2MIE0_SPOSC|nr:uncharacterized protein SPSK_06673 [Sporothrix schenckii 1099-18]KJR89448.1 hypothetical protein SPSK_06673 [Sporothrix schenckii 1099-18]